MQNMELARRFLIEYVPDEGKAALNEVFLHISKDPLLVLNNALVLLSAEAFIKEAPLDRKVSAVNGILAGFTLAYCLKFPEVEKMLANYVDNAGKARGENVISFLEKKK